jgi:ABC-type uncharacterized transport system auxiliary subunit
VRRGGRTAPAWALLLALGCSLSQPVPQPERYGLMPVRTGEVGAGEGGVLRLMRVRAGSRFEGQAFVSRTGDVYRSDYYHGFYAPPARVVRNALLAWLRASRLFGQVLDGGELGQPDWFLEGELGGLYVDRSARPPEAVVELRLRLLDARTPGLDAVLHERYAARAPAGDGSPEALVQAWERALGEVLAASERDLRAAVAPSSG